MTSLLYGDLEEELRTSVRAALLDRCAPADLLRRIESDQPYDWELWRTLARDIGCTGLAIGEPHGGTGVGFGPVSVVLEELGRAVAPVPFLSSGAVATTILLAATDAGFGDAALLATLLADLAAGVRTAALATPLSATPFSTAPWSVRAEADALTGTVTSVADGSAADVLLVPTGEGLYAVDAVGSGVTRTPVAALDPTRPLCDVTFHAAPGHLIAPPEPGDRAVRSGLTAGAALLASEQLGVAEWCLSTTVAYAKTRYQFGRPIGSFQALKHRLAEVWVAVTEARAVARHAVAALAADGPDLPVATCLAQAYCSEVAVYAAEECVQLHGGIGFTWEYPAHLYLKRAKSSAVAFGTPADHRTAVAGLVDLPAAG